MSANDEPWKPEVEGTRVLKRSKASALKRDDVDDKFNGKYWGFWKADGSAKQVVTALTDLIKIKLKASAESTPSAQASFGIIIFVPKSWKEKKADSTSSSAPAREEGEKSLKVSHHNHDGHDYADLSFRWDKARSTFRHFIPAPADRK